MTEAIHLIDPTALSLARSTMALGILCTVVYAIGVSILLALKAFFHEVCTRRFSSAVLGRRLHQRRVKPCHPRQFPLVTSSKLIGYLTRDPGS